MHTLDTDFSVIHLRRQYRYYTRLVKSLPNHSYYHQKRIKIAKLLTQTEPLQGAMADYFFACWYDMRFEGKRLMEDMADILPKHILDGFLGYIGTGDYLPKITPLATRFSVLVSPSMNVPKYKLYVGKDDAKQLSLQVSQSLIDAKKSGQDALIEEIQAQYFRHCLACQDKIGFMLTWFALAKNEWVFDDEWIACKKQLEKR